MNGEIGKKNNMYKIPNDTIFAPDRDGQRIDYGYVKSIKTFFEEVAEE